MPNLNTAACGRALTWALVLSCVFLVGVRVPLALEDPGWPREVQGYGHKLTVWQPQIEEWQYYVKLKGRMAAAIVREGTTEPVLGAIWAEADTQTNVDSRTVLIYNVKITDARFTSRDERDAAEAKRLAKALFPKRPVTISLDRILANIERTKVAAKEVQVSLQPPIILFSQTPTVLVLIDGEPILSPIGKTDLLYVVNTNWDLFLHSGTSRYYLLDEDRWLTATDLKGPWTLAAEIPESFTGLPADDNWAEVRKNVDGPWDSDRPLFTVFVSTEPAEMILTVGPPTLQPIASTGLLYVTNTDSDLFLHTEEGRYYYLVAGRWYRSEKLAGPWSVASGDLPEDFALIPTDHPRAGVRSSVPGTAEAGEAILMAQIPRKATVSRDATITVTYAGDPQFQPIEGTSMEYAVNTSYDVIKVEDSYYVCSGGVWFVGAGPQGPWVIAAHVPQVIYTIPPGSPTYRVTYVYVYDSTPDVVVVGYTSGYVGVYPVYPIYYPRPYTWGVAAWYNPYTGRYGRGAVVYGPYGGYGRGAAYNPHTGTYARGAAAWGPHGGTWAAEAYNPRTGTYAATHQSGNAYAHWGESVARRGDDWIHTGHYANEKGAGRAFETSEGGKGARVRTDDGTFGVARSAEGDLYVGKDGNVYKRDDSGWQKNSNGEWENVERERGESGERRTRDGATTQERQGSRGEGGASTEGGRGSAGGPSLQGSGNRGGGTMDGLNRDHRSRSEGNRRSHQWKSGSRSHGSSGSRGGSRRGGGRRR
jgi:hypothetical protein